MLVTIKNQKIMSYQEEEVDIATVILSNKGLSKGAWTLETVNWCGEFGNLPIGEQLKYLNKIEKLVKDLS